MSEMNEDLRLLRDAARDWIGGTAPLDARRDDSASVRSGRWRAMVEMGWAGVAIDEAHGGLDLGFAAVAALQQELGRELLPAPLLSSAIAARLLRRFGTPEQRENWLPQLAGGAVIALAADLESRHASVNATRTSAGWRLQGEHRFVPDARDAQALIVAARHESEPMLFIVAAQQLRREPLNMVDGGDFAHVHFDVELPVSAQLAADDAAAALAYLLDLARIGIASEMLGSADRALEITCDYLRIRKQFDQAIGSFQALQHRAALMLVDIELARSCIEAALDAADGGPDLPELAVVAKATANDALHRVSSEIVQMHGGIGMTAEHVAGLYLKRARVAETLYGNTAAQARRYADIRGF